MITLHESNITSFPHDNGIGVLRDVIRAYAEEELNGMFEFYMEYDSEGHLVDELKEERIIKAKAQDKLGYQLFRIYSITKNHENDNLIVQAQHITYDLADNFVESLEARNLTKKQVMEKIGSSTAYPHPFNVTSSNTTTISSTSLYRTNPLQMIGGIEGSVLQIWGGQIERDNFNLILHDRRGSDDGVKVTYEKNITGLEATFDISGLVTRIFPFVYIEATDDEPERLITVSGKYIDSPHINDYEKIYIEPIDYSSDERINTDGTDAQIRQQLTNIASQYFTETGNDKIKVDMEVQFEHLWETEEYKDLAVLELVGMGDTVTIEHSRLKVDATAIVNYIRYDCIAEKNEEVRLGSVKARLTDNVNRVVDVAEKVEQAQQTANQAIRAANGKNTIYYGPDEPEGGIEGDLWFRVIDGEYTRTYRHDGIQWQLVLSVDVRDAIDEAQQAKDEAQSAVDRANQATQQATDAINQAQTAFDEAQQALGTASNAMTQATSAFSLANDAFNEVESLSTIVDENTGEISTIKQSVIGLQTQVSDNAGNISSLTQIAQGLQTQVTDIEGNVSTLQQTAQGLQSSVTNLQDELDNLEIGGRNLLLGTTYEELTGEFSTWNSDVYYVSDNVLDEVKHGGTYTMSVYFTHTESNNNSRFGLIFQFYYSHGAHHSQYQSYNTFLESGETGWSIYTFNLPDVSDIDEIIGARVYIRSDNNATGSSAGKLVRYKWLKLEKGNKATDWTPAPEDIDHQFSVITQTIDSITTRVGDAEGNITALQQTSSSLAARLTDAEGNITTLTATVSGLQTTVTNVQGDVSSVTQLANALQVRMTNAEGDISTLTQTASSLQSTVSSLQDEWDNLEIGGTNLHRDSNNFNYDVWNMYDNGSLTVTENVTVEEWGATDATQVYAGAGNRTTILKAYKTLTNTTKTVVGEIYTVSVYVKNVRTDYPMAVRINGITPIPVITLEPGEAKRIVATGERTTSGLQIQIRSYSNDHYAELIIWRAKVEKGNKATDWTPAPEDMATQSQITQLSDAINLRVEKGDVINQINISDESILIDGKRIHITGQTTIDNGVIKSANIQSLDAGKITSGTLDAGKISVINLSANSIVGGVLQSQNENITFDLNNSTFNIRGGGYINFLDSGNGIRFQRSGQTSGMVLDTSAGHNLPMVAIGVSPSTSSGGINANHSNFKGLRVHSEGASHNTNLIEHRFIISELPDLSAGGFVFQSRFDGSRRRFFPMNTATRGYDLGTINNRWTDVYADNIKSPGYFTIQNTTASSGFRFDTTYQDGAPHIYFRGLSTASYYYAVGAPGYRFRYIYLTYEPDVSSDERLKEDISENELGLDFINDVSTKTFRMKSNRQEPLQFGILAQDLKATLEHHGINTLDHSIVKQHDDGYYGVQATQLIFPTIKAVQELDLKVESVKDDVEWLKLENQYLRQKIEQLEEMIA